MAIARAELARRARELARRVQEEWLEKEAGSGAGGEGRPGADSGWALALAGSGATGFRDTVSRLDLVAAGPAEAVQRLRNRLAPHGEPGGPGSLHRLPAWAGGGHLALLAWDELAAAARRPDEATVILLGAAEPLLDPGGRLAAHLAPLRQLPPDWYRQQAARRYRALRRRTASMAWNLRRGQAFAFLAGFVQWLEHFLLLCRYADGEPPVDRKWLLQAAMRTSLGRQCRADLYALFSGLGEIATLGGSYDPKENRLYGTIARLHGLLAAALRQRGLLDERDEPRDDTREETP
ncbi:hypothetical protein [Thermaerobacter subterraneus]|uniref:DUF4037 domain-containing protein n=1 Tax=Thermaerobacter subterraneus DSM 13965 TaxID=867903 RepID=K6QBU9_9FIRM|nr:hypothetical protein [Thermaerobacter subterraneus]EKP93886.1 hypothetical protein ThesuDRAFT_00130 [Thermaerobacter subterraneus DSM 13965]